MNASKTLLASAMGAVVTLAALAAAPAQAEKKEKCYAHGCKGQAMVDKDPGDWKLVAKGSCQQMGGNTMAPMKQ